MEEEDNQMPMSQPMAMMGHTSEGALQYQLDPGAIQEELINVLRGCSPQKDDEKGWMVWKKTSEPMINEKGLDRIRAMTTVILGGQKVFALTDVPNEQINEEVISVGENIIVDIWDNYESYEIKDSTTASYIVRMITLLTNSVLRKGEDATYLKFLRTTQQIQEVQHHQSMSQRVNQQQDRGGLKEMLFGKRRR